MEQEPWGWTRPRPECVETLPWARTHIDLGTLRVGPGSTRRKAFRLPLGIASPLAPTWQPRAGPRGDKARLAAARVCDGWSDNPGDHRDLLSITIRNDGSAAVIGSVGAHVSVAPDATPSWATWGGSLPPWQRARTWNRGVTSSQPGVRA